MRHEIIVPQSLRHSLLIVSASMPYLLTWNTARTILKSFSECPEDYTELNSNICFMQENNEYYKKWKCFDIKMQFWDFFYFRELKYALVFKNVYKIHFFSQNLKPIYFQLAKLLINFCGQLWLLGNLPQIINTDIY